MDNCQSASQQVARKFDISALCTSLAENAFEVDDAGCFVADNLKLLQENSLMSLIVPTEYGGAGGSHQDMITITRQLGASCASTAIVFAMHCQQVAVLVNHGDQKFKAEHLRRLCDEQYFVASVTTESETGGSLMATRAALEAIDGGYQLSRLAPIVTGSCSAGAFLITMRRDTNSSQSDTCLVFLTADRLSGQPVGEWRAMGMRGTGSGGVQFDAVIHANDIFNTNENFQDIAIETMIPYGHFAWCSAWLGTATGALDDVKLMLRHPAKRGGFDFSSDLLWDRIGRVQMKIHSAEAFLTHVANAYAEALKSDRRAGLRSPSFQMLINGLKVFCSEVLFDAVNELVELVGIRHGYLESKDTKLELRLRDLRSASLMYKNDRLTTINGKFCLLGEKAMLI